MGALRSRAVRRVGGRNVVAEMRWAPVATDKVDDAGYIAAVIKAHGIDPDKPIELRETRDLGPDYPENLTVLIGFAAD